MKRILIGTAAAALFTVGAAVPAAAGEKGYGATFNAACGKSFGQVVAAGQPRTEDSAHYRSGYKGGVQGLLNSGAVLDAHLPLCAA
jgi:hypothetical protein